ncbi:MAG: amidohydrolase family protein [Anaerovoracaceae bacterium]
MAFNLFKKNEKAEVIYSNGKVFTQDSDYPWASAVACQNNKIVAVGDFEAMDNLIDNHTTIVDLDGKYMFPGFIDAHGIAVLDVFEDKYFAIDVDWDLETVLAHLADYANNNPDLDVIFGYGYNESIIESYEDIDERCKMLNAIDEERPILLLGESCMACWYNSTSGFIISDTANEECVDFVSLDYVLNLFVPFDFDEIEASVKEVSNAYCDKGYTSIFNTYSPEYFDDLYLDSLMGLINHDLIRQRFFGSLYVNRPINPDLLMHKLMNKKTSCVEIGHILSYDFLKLSVSSKDFSQSTLDTIMLAAADRGFNIHADGLDQESLENIYAAFETVRANGYKNNTLAVASDFKMPEDALSDLEHALSFIQTWETSLTDHSITSKVSNVAEAIDNLTIIAAEIIGASKDLGSIEKGKLADFVVFEENPLDMTLNQFSKAHANMTVLGGEIVYDEDDEANDELYDLISTMQL